MSFYSSISVGELHYGLHDVISGKETVLCVRVLPKPLFYYNRHVYVVFLCSRVFVFSVGEWLLCGKNNDIDNFDVVWIQLIGLIYSLIRLMYERPVNLST